MTSLNKLAVLQARLVEKYSMLIKVRAAVAENAQRDSAILCFLGEGGVHPCGGCKVKDQLAILMICERRQSLQDVIVRECKIKTGSVQLAAESLS